MSERKIVQKTNAPATIETLRTDLGALGVRSGMVLLVHSSLGSTGWVCGGSVAVIMALQNVLGSTGTLVMPAHSTDLTEPGKWENPPVPASWWPVIRETMPAFDVDLTPTRSMGIVAETFRKQRGVLRSAHPHYSFCARGPRASRIISDHSLDFALGKHSPLARIYDLHGFVLLLGVRHARNTSMHLAEYRATFPAKRVVREGAPVSTSGARRWTSFEDINLDSSDFDRIGEDFLRSDAGKAVRRGQVGLANCQLMPQRDVVDFATGWLEEHRSQ